MILRAGEAGRADFDESGWNRFIEYMSLEPTRARLLDQSYLTLCYFIDARIVGVITIRDYARINQLFVLAEARQIGVARKLWEAAKEICHKQGNKGRFSVRSSAMAIPGYEKFGFRIAGDKKVEDGVSFTPLELVC